jgi:hypothetical protein
MTTKRSELANILRKLADYIDRHPDENLAPIFEQAAKLMPTAGSQKKNDARSQGKISPQEAEQITTELRAFSSREIGDAFLQRELPNRRALETIARFLQLPVQRDDSVERLRAKIIENTIGSRLRSDAIQGKNNPS